MALAGTALVLTAGDAADFADLRLPWQHRRRPRSTPGRRASRSCEIQQASAALRSLPKGEIMAPIDIGPQLLYDTDHSVIATGHHRGGQGMRW